MNIEYYTRDMVKLKLLMRRHVGDHVIWSRLYMVSLLGNLPDLDKVEERLSKNQDAIGNCMREFFGDLVIDNFISLRKEHMTLIIDLLKAIKDRDAIKASVAENDLVTNVENISTLLSIANPCYSREELIDMFNTHLILAKYEFIARMSEDYNADIIYFDMSMHHADMLSDYITRGIIERFFEEQIMITHQTQYQPEIETPQTDILQTDETPNQE